MYGWKAAKYLIFPYGKSIWSERFGNPAKNVDRMSVDNISCFKFFRRACFIDIQIWPFVNIGQWCLRCIFVYHCLGKKNKSSANIMLPDQACQRCGVENRSGNLEYWNRTVARRYTNSRTVARRYTNSQQCQAHDNWCGTVFLTYECKLLP